MGARVPEMVPQESTGIGHRWLEVGSGPMEDQLWGGEIRPPDMRGYSTIVRAKTLTVGRVEEIGA